MNKRMDNALLTLVFFLHRWKRSKRINNALLKLKFLYFSFLSSLEAIKETS